MYQSPCPECCLRAGPEGGRGFWTAGGTAVMNSPACWSRRQETGDRKQGQQGQKHMQTSTVEEEQKTNNNNNFKLYTFSWMTGAIIWVLISDILIRQNNEHI